MDGWNSVEELIPKADELVLWYNPSTQIYQISTLDDLSNIEKTFRQQSRNVTGSEELISMMFQYNYWREVPPPPVGEAVYELQFPKQDTE